MSLLPTEQDEFSRQDKLQTPSVTQQQKGEGLKMAVGGVPSHRDQWIFCVSNRGGQELTPANLMTAAVGSGPSRRYYSVRSQVDDGRERDANTDMGAEFSTDNAIMASLHSSSPVTVSAIVPARALCEFGIVIINADYSNSLNPVLTISQLSSSSGSLTSLSHIIQSTLLAYLSLSLNVSVVGPLGAECITLTHGTSPPIKSQISGGLVKRDKTLLGLCRMPLLLTSVSLAVEGLSRSSSVREQLQGSINPYNEASVEVVFADPLSHRMSLLLMAELVFDKSTMGLYASPATLDSLAAASKRRVLWLYEVKDEAITTNTVSLFAVCPSSPSGCPVESPLRCDIVVTQKRAFITYRWPRCCNGTFPALSSAGAAASSVGEGKGGTEGESLSSNGGVWSTSSDTTSMYIEHVVSRLLHKDEYIMALYKSASSLLSIQYTSLMETGVPAKVRPTMTSLL